MSAARIRRALSESLSGLPSQFWWLWTSTLVNRLGAFVATFLALYLTVERGYSASYAGLIGALYGLGSVVSSVGGGVLADRIGRRPTLLLAQTSTAVSVAALGFVEHPLAIAALAWAVGLATNASRPAVQAMIADIVAPEDRVRAFALNFWAINMGFAVSSTAAGLVAQYSYQLLFVGEAVMVLACAVVVFLKLPESRPEQEVHGQAGGGTGDAAGTGGGTAGGAGGAVRAGNGVSLWTVLRHGRFMVVAGLNLIMTLLIQQAFVALPVSMGLDGFSSSDFGLVIAVNGVLIVLLQLPVTRFIAHRDPSRLLILSALLTGCGFGLHAFAGSVAFYLFAVCVWTVGEIINSPTQMGLVVRLSPTLGRGRYQGVYVLSSSLAALIAPLMGGFAIDSFGADSLWGVSALLGVGVAVGYGLLLRRMGRDDGGTETDGAKANDAAAGAGENEGAGAPRTEGSALSAPPAADTSA